MTETARAGSRCAAPHPGRRSPRPAPPHRPAATPAAARSRRPTVVAPCPRLGRRDDRRSATRRLLLLDGHSLAYRAFFALPVENFSTTTGQPTNAVYGFTSMLINVLRDEEPTHLAVAFDVSRQTFRSEAYAEYKAGRQRDARPTSAARSP